VTPSNPPNFYPVSWDELHRNARALAWHLSEKGKWKNVLAVARGGLVPAALVARDLGIRAIETVVVVGYQTDDENPSMIEEARIEKLPANVGDGEGWLVIDDLADTGRTLKILREIMPKAHFATVYAKPTGKPLVDTFVTEVGQDTWIDFPWEISSRNPRSLESEA